jgi:hypothetical protein
LTMAGANIALKVRRVGSEVRSINIRMDSMSASSYIVRVCQRLEKETTLPF